MASGAEFEKRALPTKLGAANESTAFVAGKRLTPIGKLVLNGTLLQVEHGAGA